MKNLYIRDDLKFNLRNNLIKSFQKFKFFKFKNIINLNFLNLYIYIILLLRSQYWLLEGDFNGVVNTLAEVLIIGGIISFIFENIPM